MIYKLIYIFNPNKVEGTLTKLYPGDKVSQMTFCPYSFLAANKGWKMWWAALSSSGTGRSMCAHQRPATQPENSHQLSASE